MNKGFWLRIISGALAVASAGIGFAIATEDNKKMKDEIKSEILEEMNNEPEMVPEEGTKESE